MDVKLHLEDNATWKRRFRAPIVVWTQIAQSNRERGLAVTNRSGKYQLYSWDVPSGELRPLTDSSAGILFGTISGDGRYIYYLDDKQGNEIGHFVRMTFENDAVQDVSPELPVYSSFSFETSGSGSRFGFTAASEDGFDIYDIETKASGELGTPHKLFHSKKIAFGPIYSFDGEIAVVATSERTAMQHYDLQAYNTLSGAKIADLWDGPETSLEPLISSPLPGDQRFIGMTNRSGARRPLIWNPVAGERTDLELPELEGDVLAVDWSPDARSLLLCQFTQAVQHLFSCDLSTQTLKKLDHPAGNYEFVPHQGTYFRSEDEIFAQWQDATHPNQLITLDAHTGVKQRVVLAAGEVPPGHAWKSIRFPSSDGQMIQGWLGVPDGPGPFPTILHTHGGPESVMTEYYLPSSQMWMDHGFAFLTINYRGSVTFGREFQEKIWGNVGYWETEDIAAARLWLVTEGISLPNAIFLTGWSYGGYNTLMGLSKYPDLWAGGLAGIAISDWAMLYEDAAETLRGYDVALFGGTPQEKPDQYRISSPISYAENVKAPLLIIQGRNDTRTPARPIEVYEQRMKELGKSIEVHWFDAGHMGEGIEQDIKHYELMLKFAWRLTGF